MSEEKTKTALLREELMMKEDKGIKSLSAEEIAKADEFCEGYKRFLNAAPVEREATAEALRIAKEQGRSGSRRSRALKNSTPRLPIRRATRCISSTAARRSPLRSSAKTE